MDIAPLEELVVFNAANNNISKIPSGAFQNQTKLKVRSIFVCVLAYGVNALLPCAGTHSDKQQDHGAEAHQAFGRPDHARVGQESVVPTAVLEWTCRAQQTHSVCASGFSMSCSVSIFPGFFLRADNYASEMIYILDWRADHQTIWRCFLTCPVARTSLSYA